MTRELRKEIEVAGSAAEVWAAWTTSAGVVEFFAPQAWIEPRVGGAYELYFLAEAPEGSRGSEGCRFLELEPERRLVVSWNFPPSIPAIRHEQTRVEIALDPVGDRATRVRMTQTGWREGDDWDQGYAYFDRAWGLVLARLARRFERGPIDWADPWLPEAP
jgi:uncharacterized protein YndB with AHSA1/START domain